MREESSVTLLASLQFFINHKFTYVNLLYVKYSLQNKNVIHLRPRAVSKLLGIVFPMWTSLLVNKLYK